MMTKVREGYKETEIGAIPDDWEVNTLFDISKNKGEYGIGAKAVDYKKEKPRYLRITDIDDFGRLIENSEYKTIEEDDFQSYVLKNDDLVFARTGNTTGKTYLYNPKDGELVFAGFLIKFSIDSSKAISEYVRQYCFTKRYWDWVKQSSTRSGQPGINSKQYGELILPVPPLPEQQRIAEILSTTDAHIEKLDKTIEDYQLLKKGMMKKLLTEGIGHTEFKDTEIGRIPKEWEMIMLGELAQIKRGASPRPIKDTKWFSDVSDVGWIRISDVTKSDKYLSKTVQYLSDEGIKKSRPVYKGDLIMSICASIGVPIILNMDACIHDGFVVFSNLKNNRTSVEYLYYYLNHIQESFKNKGQTGTQANINTDLVNETILGLPPLKEQTEIINILSEFDIRLKLYENELNDFIQLKKSLIEKLLTGKIRTTEIKSLEA